MFDCLLSFEKFKMADCSLDELLAEVGNLSINKLDCSRSIKDTKKQNECSILDALWSEDDVSEVETSLNLTKICSLNFSVDENEDFQFPALLSRNNVTVRRKTKKKRHVSEDNRSENCSSHIKDGPEDQESPLLDNIYCGSQINDVSIAMHQENAVLDSFPISDDESPDVCRKLNNDFEQVENSSFSDLNVSSNFLLDNDLSERLQHRIKNIRDSTTCKDRKLLDWECDRETNSFEKVSLERNLQHINSANTESPGKHPTKEAICQNFNNDTSVCSTDNELDISTNSFTSLTNNQEETGDIEKCRNQNCVYELKHYESLNSHQERIQSNTRGDIITVPPKIENSIDQNVFQPKREFDTPSTHAKHNNSSTARDQSLICLNPVVEDNKDGIAISYDDESKIFNKCDSRQMNVEKGKVNKTVEDTAVSSKIQNYFMKPADNDVLESNSHNVADLVSKIDPLLSNSQLKKTTDTSNESPVTCQLNRNNKRLSNKENVCTPARKKTVIISLSDYDSVWEDGLESDDSDCGKYNIPLSSRLEKDMSNQSTSKKETNAKSGSSIRTPCSNDRKPALLSRNVKFSDSSDDDEFEQFLDKMKTPKPKSTPRYRLKSFIVEDNWVDSSEDDDDDNGVTFPFMKPKSTIGNKDLPTFTPNTAPAKRPTLATLPKRNFPVKKFNTPRLKTTPLKINTKDNTPREISSGKSIKRIVTPYVNTPHKFWRKSRDLLIEELFKCYNETVFDNKLPVDLPIIWNKQMTKTAGFCYYIGSINKKCRIELSDKVVDSCDRIRDTLIHELCHAATWLIDGVRAGHGPHWKRWAHKARMVHSDLPPISRCHSYDINYKFTYRCVKCQHSFGRHSKSVNLKTARCPYCLSHLELLPRLNKDGTPAKTRAPTKFSLFVKDNYGKMKAKEPRSSHQEIMKELSKQFAQQVALEKENSSTKT